MCRGAAARRSIYRIHIDEPLLIGRLLDALLDILLDAPEPRVAARGAERSVESARRVASVCRPGLRAVIVATWSAVGVGVRRTLATVRL